MIKTEEILSIEDVYTELGTGVYQYKVFVLCYLIYVLYGFHCILLSILINVIDKEWALTTEEKGLCVIIANIGLIVGFAISG